MSQTRAAEMLEIDRPKHEFLRKFLAFLKERVANMLNNSWASTATGEIRDITGAVDLEVIQNYLSELSTYLDPILIKYLEGQIFFGDEGQSRPTFDMMSSAADEKPTDLPNHNDRSDSAPVPIAELRNRITFVSDVVAMTTETLSSLQTLIKEAGSANRPRTTLAEFLLRLKLEGGVTPSNFLSDEASRAFFRVMQGIQKTVKRLKEKGLTTLELSIHDTRSATKRLVVNTESSGGEQRSAIELDTLIDTIRYIDTLDVDTNTLTSALNYLEKISAHETMTTDAVREFIQTHFRKNLEDSNKLSA